MDKENKYYNLIEKLVKNHKKFPGYEAIIDDIIDDVYSHAEVVIKSIDNESVIEAYLTKVIATSIITVPRNLNYQKANEKKEPVANFNFSVIDKQKASPELVDKMINSSSDEKEEFDEQENLEIVSVEPDEQALASDLSYDVELKDTHDELLDNNIEDNDILNELSDENAAADSTKINYSEVSDYEDLSNLEVDDVKDTEESFEIQENSEASLMTDDFGSDSKIELEDDVQEENSVDFESYEMTENSFNDNVDVTSIEEINQEDNNGNVIEELTLDDNESAEEQSNEFTEEYTDIQEVESLELDDSENVELDFPSVENDNDINDSIELNEIEELEDTSLQPENTIDEFDSLDLDITDNIDNADKFDELEQVSFDADIEEFEADDNNLDVLTVNEELDTNEEFDLGLNADDSIIQSVDATSDYLESNSKPDYEIEDSQQLINGVKNLNIKRPDLNIVKVYDLKYNKKLTVDQIAAELNIDTTVILEALTELEALI